MLGQYASLHLKNFMQLKISPSEYPMGGKFFADNTTSQNLKLKFETTLKNLSKKPKIAQKIKHLLQVIEDESL